MAAAKLFRFAATPPEEADLGALAAAIHGAAADLTAAEAAVRDAILAALDRRDVPAARRLVERWTLEPITDLAAGL